MDGCKMILADVKELAGWVEIMEDLYTWDITDQDRLLTQQNWKGFRIQRGIYKCHI